MTVHWATGASNACQEQLSAIETLLDGGTLIITDDTTLDPDTALTGTTLVTFTFSASPDTLGAFSVTGTAPSKIVTGTAAFSASSEDAAETGTASAFALLTSAGTQVAVGSVGTSGADINFDSVAFSSGASITLSSFTVSVPS